jgi:TIR domain
MPNKVFISYRREDSRYQAHRIYDAFVRALPPDTVFMDIDTIPPGADFVEILEGWVQQCDVLLALIGPNWLGSIDPRSSLRRLDNPEDFVRIEIRGALARKIPVVPVLLDATGMPTATELPDDIKALRRRNAEFVDFRTFDADVQRLIKRLKIGKKVELPGEAPGPRTEDRGGSRTAGATTASPFLDRIKVALTAGSVLGAAGALLVVLLLLGLALTLRTTVMRPDTQTDVPVRAADFARSEEGRRSAEARAKEATDALAVAEKARLDAEARASSAAAAQARAEENLRAAEKARAAAEGAASGAAIARAQADNSRQLAEARANDAVEALKKSEKARQDAEARLAALSTPVARQTPGSPSLSSGHLLNIIGGKSRWAKGSNPNCANSLSLEAGNSSLTWVDDLGKMETEKVIVSYENAFQTSAPASQQTFVYARDRNSNSGQPNRLVVQSSNGSSFLLERCP